ncbi:uncharacterized protein LOC111399229 [Olea europaea var. sylvestris]|uniref:uncharacterized protein LOC111399229 n=1 Tax=Olea europaea var. sylvestris TaxID=158386 RepID=UPI000C1D81C5|nr:uncharacterized protein LOC111399229 [Olea europaea var. sylvestris]
MSLGNNNGNLMESINRVISEPYYLLHFLAFFSYIPIRCSASNVFSPLRSSHLLYREIQAALAFFVLSAVKVVKVETWEAFISDTLFFAKIFFVAIALVMDYHVALWYALIFSVIYIIAQQPAYEGLGTANQLTPLQLETLLSEGNKSKIWLVGFWTCSYYFSKDIDSLCMSLQMYCANVVVGELINKTKIRSEKNKVVVVMM